MDGAVSSGERVAAELASCSRAPSTTATSPAPARSSSSSVVASVTDARSRMRSANGSSSERPTTAWQATPPCRQRVATSPAILPWRLCSSRLPSPVTTKVAARMRPSKPRASSTNGGAGHEPRSARGPEPAREPPGGAGHRLAGRVPGPARRPAGQPPLQPLHRRARRRPSAGRTRAARPRTACARRTPPRAPPPRRPRRAPPARRRRRRWWPSRPRSPPPARRRPPTAAAISSPVPRVLARQASRSSSATSASPLARAISTSAGAAVREQRELGARRGVPADRSPSRCGARRRARPGARPSCPRRRRPPAAPPPRGPRCAAPRRWRAATSAAPNVPLKLSGATSAGPLTARR